MVRLSILVLGVALAGCARSPAPAPPIGPALAALPGLRERVLRPEALDPAADKYLHDQYAYLDTRALPAGKLAVYLVGANGKPEGSRPMLTELAAMGFPVLAPAYANDYDIRARCEKRATEPDEDCHGKARLEAFEGVDHSRHLEVSRSNSIEGRVARMLAHLAQVEPDRGWGAFLDGAEPRWSEIVVSGHSHGASSAGLIGKVRRVHRVVMLSGPFDNRDGDAAAWTRRASLTPLERVYAFSHTLEEQHPGHLADWTAMGLGGLGPVVVVLVAVPPFGGSHQLVTSLPPGPRMNPHGMTTAGRASPRLDDGTYQFAAVWRYLYDR